MNSSIPLRQIRSFVRRDSRLTKGQAEALEIHWSRYGIELSDHPVDMAQLFQPHAAVTLEIGFGNGDSLVEMAAAQPDHLFLGIEVHRPGIGHILQRADQLSLANLRILREDAIEVLNRMIPKASLNKVQLFFPDPWHKRRHHKRRIVDPAFLRLIASRLQPGGHFHMATDWKDYAHAALALLEQSPDFINTTDNGSFLPRPESRPITKFERRGQRLNHGVWDLAFRTRNAEPPSPPHSVQP